jgi:Lrp/AsnC family leucine-responsive transcriptional regulator
MVENNLDDVDKQLIALLSVDARASASALGSQIGMTRQGVTERLDRLKRDGVIQHYTVTVDPEKMGLNVRAFLAVTLMPACSDKQEQNVIYLLHRNPWVRECYRVTGDDYFQARVVAPEIAEVRQLLLDLRATGVVQSTRTLLALETLFEKTSGHFLEQVLELT